MGRGIHLVTIEIPTVCWQTHPPNVANMFSINNISIVIMRGYTEYKIQSNRKIVETEAKSLGSSLDTDTSLKSGGAKLVL